MPTTETIALLLSGLAGLLVGAVFFGGLWWTVGRVMTSERPALLHLASLLLRTVFVLAAFYWIGGPDWRRLLACLGGFVLARLLVMRVTGSTRAPGPCEGTG